MNSLPPNRATEKNRTHTEQNPISICVITRNIIVSVPANVENAACYPFDLDFDWGLQPGTPSHKKKDFGKWATHDNNHKL